MAPNRSRSNSNAPAHNQRTNSPNVNRAGYRNQQFQQQLQTYQQTSKLQAHPAPVSTPQRGLQSSADLGMSPGSRYNQNLKVLRRHDPSIISIFDQFSHVCLYHHDGTKWEKKGYEGTMFLFERCVKFIQCYRGETAPKYGFFILNRMGMNDYIQCINRTDDMAMVGEYLMYRSYTPYTKTSRARSNNGMASTSEDEASEEAGQPEIIGLWTLGIDAIEPLSTVMMRLQKYARLGQPYPEEFRHDLGRRLPEVNLTSQEEEDVFAPRSTSKSNNNASASSSSNTGRKTKTSNLSNGTSQPPPPQSNASELDKLFAKLIGPDVPKPNSSVPPPAPAPQVTTADSLLEMLKNSSARQAPRSPLQSSNSFLQTINSSQSQPPSGKALLDSIFASASSSALVPSFSNTSFPPPPSAPPPDAIPLHLQTTRTANGDAPTSESVIYSPKPSSAILPQILTADVIHELMGMPSRSESSTSSSYSPLSAGAGGRKIRKDQDRGYIADRGEDDGLSESSAGFEASMDIEADERLANSRVAATSISRSTFLSAGSSSSGNIKGDATPRARSERGLEPVKVQSRESIAEFVAAMSAPAPGGTKSPVAKASARRAAERTVSECTVTATQSASATLVAFPSGTELWPHERTSTQGFPDSGNSSRYHIGTMPNSAPAVVEKAMGKEEDVVELDFSEIGVLDDMKAFEAKEAPMSRRAKARAKSQAQVQVQADIGANGTVPAQAALPSAPASASGKAEGKTKRGKKDGATSAQANGAPAQEITSSRTADTTANGAKSPQSFPEVAQSVLLKSALDSGVKTTPTLGKNEFVRELLTLIHTDRSFVEKLYDGYLNTAKST